jgi:hemolysin activation/secretion protein
MALLGLLVFRSAPAADTTAPDAKPAQLFDINEIDVYGSSVLPRVDIERSVYPFLGSARSSETVQDAAKALEKLYRDRGYGTVYVDIPEQTIEGGVVKLRVTEGRIERVSIRGARFFSERQIRTQLPALVVGAVPHLPDVQQELASVNAREPDRHVVPVLKAGSEPGTVAVDLNVNDQLPLHGSIEVDNRYTADTAHTRLSGSLSYDNFFGQQDSLSLQYQTAPTNPSNAQIGALTFVLRPQGWGSALAAYVLHSDSNVAALGTLYVIGKGTVAGLRWIEPLPAPGPESSASFSLAGEYKHFSQAVQVNSTSGVSTPITYLNWSGQYALSHLGERNSTALNVSAALGLRGVVNDVVEFESNRAGARPDYFYLRGNVQSEQRLPGGLAIFGRAAGQWTGAPLINNEQFTLGGVDTVRGYLESEALGDTGWDGSLELRTPRVGARLRALQGLYGYVFADAGAADIIDPLPGQTALVRIASLGFGLRREAARGFSESLDAADPRRAGPRTREGDWHAHFSVRYGF